MLRSCAQSTQGLDQALRQCNKWCNFIEHTRRNVRDLKRRHFVYKDFLVPNAILPAGGLQHFRSEHHCIFSAHRFLQSVELKVTPAVGVLGPG